MCLSTTTVRLAEAEDPVSIVLGAERDALSEIEDFKRKAMQLVVASRLRALLVRKRVDLRIARLREQMTAAAQLRLETISSEMEALATDIVEDAALLAPLEIAIAGVTAELAGKPASG